MALYTQKMLQALAKKYPFRFDNQIVFNEERHEYLLFGVKCQSVTTLLQSIKKSCNIEVMKRQTAKSIVTRANTWKSMFQEIPIDDRMNQMRKLKYNKKDVLWPRKYDQYFSQDKWRIWEQYVDTEEIPENAETLPPPYCKNPYQIVSDAWLMANKRGTRMHSDIEHFLEDPTKPVDNPTPEFKNFLRYYYSNPDLIICRSELRVGNVPLKLCGTIDVVFLVDPDDPNTVDAGDWKCTNSIISQNPEEDLDYDKGKKMGAPFQMYHDTKRNAYMLQLNLYAYMLEQHGYTVRNLPLIQCHHELDQPIIINMPNIRNTPQFKEFINNRLEAVKKMEEEEQKKKEDATKEKKEDAEIEKQVEKKLKISDELMDKLFA